MKDLFKGILLILIGLVLIVIIVFGLQYVGLINTSFFAPRFANVNRQVFENTQSYIEGKRQEINKYRLEYMKAKANNKTADVEALRQFILSSTANLDKSKLDYDQRTFLDSLK